MQGFLAGGFVWQKRLRVDPYFQILAQVLVC
jgi:hypothetical protein